MLGSIEDHHFPISENMFFLVCVAKQTEGGPFGKSAGRSTGQHYPRTRGQPEKTVFFQAGCSERPLEKWVTEKESRFGLDREYPPSIHHFLFSAILFTEGEECSFKWPSGEETARFPSN